MSLKKHVLASIFILVLGLVVSSFTILSNKASAEWTKQESAGVLNLFGYTMSSDGTKVIAWSSDNDYVYTSSNGGVNWTKQEDAGALDLVGFAMSSDGTKVVATSNSDHYVYTSSNGGVNWTKRSGSYLSTYGMSSDGTKVIATSQYDGRVQLSSNGGVSWDAIGIGTESLSLYDIVMSSDGTKVIATSNSDHYVYTSSNGGVNWTKQEDTGALNLVGFAMSSDGTKVIATSNSDYYVYTSSNGGVNWTKQEDAGALLLNYLAMSSDGTKVIATSGNDSYIYTSSDLGVNWTKQEDAGALNLHNFAISSNGTRIVAGTWDGYVYTYTPPISIPTITTNTATDVTATSATLNGTIMDNGGENPEVGFNFGLDTNYEEGVVGILNEGQETFYAEITNLTCGTTYYYQAGGANSAGEGDGENITFTTSACPEIPTFAGGSGTELSPYQIETCQQLEDINFTPDNGDTYPFLTTGKYFILKNDIDCSMTNPDDSDFDEDGIWSDGKGFMPIGMTGSTENGWINYNAPFYGFFDGDNHTISGLYINRPYYYEVGLFGYIYNDDDNISTIKDLSIENADITAYAASGILLGEAYYTDISHVSVSGEMDTISTQLAPATFHLSQLKDGKYEEVYSHHYEVKYSTENFEFNNLSDSLTLKINQKNLPFSDIDAISLNACGVEVNPTYAKDRDGVSIIDDIATIDNNVTDAHEKDIEISWNLPSDCTSATLSLTANEYGHAIPFEFVNSNNKYVLGTNNKTLTIDGDIDEVENMEPTYSPYWRPSTGHPDGNVYFYVTDDANYLYLSADIAIDNTDDADTDWMSIYINGKRFKIDDNDNTYGVCAFGLTDKVSWGHQTCEMRIPKNEINTTKPISFILNYYGTLGQGVYTGGLIGGLYNSNISNTYSDVNITGGYTSGGVAGFSNNSNISNSYSVGNVSGDNYVGGFIGQTNGNYNISNSYSVGNVSGNNYVGGFIGWSRSLNFILNSGWYKSSTNSTLKGIGSVNSDDGADITYNETDNTVFYSKNHGVYALGQEGGWNFTTPIWYEYTDNYPQFVEQESITSPTVSTSSASSISQTEATLNGEVTDNGGEEPTEVGFQYGLTIDTYAINTVESTDYSSGTFSYNLTDLECNTTYYFRSHATNSAGTSYGDDETFTTDECEVETPTSTHHSSRVVGGYIKSSSSSNNTQNTNTTTDNNNSNTQQIQLSFTRLLKLNIIGDDVKSLQQWLNTHGYILASTGPGSLNNETTKFGPLTKKAVIAFQIANNLTPDGIVGSITLGKMNEVK